MNSPTGLHLSTYGAVDLRHVSWMLGVLKVIQICTAIDQNHDEGRGRKKNSEILATNGPFYQINRILVKRLIGFHISDIENLNSSNILRPPVEWSAGFRIIG